MPIRKDERGRWHVELCVRRQRVHRVCPANTTKAQAQQLEAEIRKDLYAAGTGTANRLISDALANYVENHLRFSKSYKDSVSHVYRLADWVKGLRLTDASRVCEQFKSEARESYSNATINRSIAALRRACHLAYTLEWVGEPVHLKIKSLPENNARHVYLSKEQITALAQACQDDQARDAIMIAAYTGLRLGELLRLTPDNIVDGMIRIDANTKTGQPRAVPIVPGIRKALKRLPFTYPKRKIQAEFEKARKRARMPHVRFHDLRHTTASLLAAQGVSLPIIGRILGHASPATTQRYAHLSDEAVRAAMRKIA
jgi:integrase